MRAIILNDYCYVQGGASRVAIDEAVGLAAAGVEVTFIGAVGPVTEELQRTRVRVVNLGQQELTDFRSAPLVALQSLWNSNARHVLAHELRASRPEDTIVHFHGFIKSISAAPLAAAAGARVPVVCTLHDFFTACPNGSFFDFNAAQICHRRAMSLPCITTNCDRRGYGHKVYRLVRTALQNGPGGLPSGFTDFIGLSGRSVEVLRPYLPVDARIHMLRNPIDMGRQPRVDVAQNSEVVALGRLDTEKGVEILVDAARRANTRLTLVGEGPWRSHAESYSGCRVTGWLPREQVSVELERARCLAFPSLWYETYGLVVDEAAARGVPALVSDVCAASERVEDGSTGWHFTSGDTNSLARALTLVRSDEVVDRAGLACYERFWADPPTLANHIEQLCSIYVNALAALSTGKGAYA